MRYDEGTPGARPALAAASDWELATARPAPALRGDVVRYQGYSEHGTTPIRRRELPQARVVLIINFGPPVRVAEPDRPTVWSPVADSFVAGLDDRYSLVETRGMRGMQVDFTPIGAHRFFGLPMRRLAKRVVPLTDVLGGAAVEWVERLEAAPDWDARFEILDAHIAGVLARSEARTPGVEWAWQRLRKVHGRAGIGELARELGWSRQRLIRAFREGLGMPPKSIARLLRFQRALRMIGDDPSPRWSEITYRCGYYDQSHLTRDFRQFAGCTPGELVRRRLPEGGGFAV